MKIVTLLDGLTGDQIATVQLADDEPIRAAVDALARRAGQADIEAAVAIDERWRRVGAICGDEVYKDALFVHPSGVGRPKRPSSKPNRLRFRDASVDRDAAASVATSV